MHIYIDRATGKVSPSFSPLTFAVSVDDNFTLSKTIEVQEGEKQKTNDQGQLLYKINSFENEEVGEVWSETTEVNDNPVLLPNIINKITTFAEDPTQFTVEEILQAKYQSLLDNSNYDNIIADIFLNEDDIDLADKDHAANTGIAIMQLLPNGQAKTKSITLQNEASSFVLLELEGDGVDVYINDTKIINSTVSLSAAVSEVVIKFVNTTSKPADVKSYAIVY